jgi:hypothetical protein
MDRNPSDANHNLSHADDRNPLYAHHNPSRTDRNPSRTDHNPSRTDHNPSRTDHNPSHANHNPSHANHNPSHADCNPSRAGRNPSRANRNPSPSRADRNPSDANHDFSDADAGALPIDELLVSENEFITIDPCPVPHSPSKSMMQPLPPAPQGHLRVTILRKLIDNLPHQLAEASEADFSFSNIQPTEDDLETYSLSGVYHNVLASIFGPRSSVKKLSHEERTQIHAISVCPRTEGVLSPIQEATQLDGSVLWGRGVNAVKIADDFDAALVQLPGDGPLLNWVENIISMALNAYSLFHRPVRTLNPLQ